MKVIQHYLVEQQKHFSDHPFFTCLETKPDFSQVLPILPLFSFWVGTFQDILKLNKSKVSDPTIRHIVKTHQEEDSGHEVWFFEDLQSLGIEIPSVKTLFGSQHESIRQASFSLCGEVFVANSDRERLVLILTLESTGHVFFNRMAKYIDDVQPNLKYFSRYHLNVEKNHDLFEQEVSEYLSSVKLSTDERKRCLEAIDRCYQAFINLFSGIENRMITDKKLQQNKSVRDKNTAGRLVGGSMS